MTDDRLIRIMAYVDGELDPTARAAFEQEIAADLALAREVERHRALANRVAGAYAPVLDEPAPIRLARAARPGRRPAATWAALAASMVIGVLLGRFALAPQTPLAIGGEARAGSPLAQALNQALTADAGPVRIGLSFQDRTGAYCRTFRSEPDRLAGLACRRDGAWRVVTATAWEPGESPAYRTAATEIPPEVLASVDRMLAGEVLARDEEAAARDRGWVRPD